MCQERSVAVKRGGKVCKQLAQEILEEVAEGGEDILELSSRKGVRGEGVGGVRVWGKRCEGGRSRRRPAALRAVTLLVEALAPVVVVWPGRSQSSPAPHQTA